MNDGSNGIARLQSVSNQNGPNVFSEFEATTTDANIKVYNGGSNGGTEHVWKFDKTGNLTLPADGDIKNSTGTSQYISLSSLKTLVADSTDFADFQTRIAGL
jgi:hypothetical protein